MQAQQQSRTLRRALYALSADLITYGHVNIAERAAALFDEVVVGIGVNPTKNYLFSLQHRVALAEASLKHLSNVRVEPFTGMLADFAVEERVDVVIKGVRNAADFDYELLLHQVGLSQQAGLDTHVLFADPQLAHVSSSVVKAIQLEHGVITDYVPLPVKAALEARLSGQVIVGVTGTIAAGKTTLCETLVARGEVRGVAVHHIDSDKLAHRIIGELEGGLYRNVRLELAELLGDEKILSDRARLAERVFSDAPLRLAINDILRKPMLLQLRKALRGKRGIVLLESALMTEAKLMPISNNRVILVSAPDALRHRRMLARNYSSDDCMARNSAQFDTGKKRLLAEEAIAKEGFGELWEISSETSSDETLDQMLDKLTALSEGVENAGV